MSVSSLLNPLQPIGVTGPPEVMAGQATVAGDGTGGTATISFAIPAGFLWMPQWWSFRRSGVATAMDLRPQLFQIDDRLTAGDLAELVEIGAVTGLAPAAQRAFPRVLLKTVTREAIFRVVDSVNTNAVNYSLYVRFLRWSKVAAPEAWMAFLVAPP